MSNYFQTSLSPGLDADTVDLIFGNIKDILLFEVVFQNDLEQAKEMVRDDLSVLVGCVFVDKALVSPRVITETPFSLLDVRNLKILEFVFHVKTNNL